MHALKLETRTRWVLFGFFKLHKNGAHLSKITEQRWHET